MNKEEQLAKMRHSCEHVLTQAVLRLYPEIKMAMGPATGEGFYFDFDPSTPPRPFDFSQGKQAQGCSGQALKISEVDFPKIEAEMEKIIRANLPIKREEISVKEARKLFVGNPYKQEWLDEIEQKGGKAIIYWTGDEFVDLCSGPHLVSTGKIGAFKLLSVAGAYWRGDEKNKMLTRIYGTCFPTKKQLSDYLMMLTKAQQRDHRKLGSELDLFSINPLTGAGLILWHQKLATVRNIVEQFWKEEHLRYGYQLVYTPHISSMDMFVISRHLSKYINYMFPVMLHQYIEGESAHDYKVDEVLKPMNCPNHIQIYKSRPRSYRELPIRMAELGTVYRYERAGVLHGMTRVRGFTQDDSHIFCRSDQVIDEVKKVIRLTKYFYEVFGFKDYQAYIATRPEKYLGSAQMWKSAQNALKKAAEDEGVNYKIDEGQGVFYGPKIDSKVKDSLGREWQLGTIQFDFNLPAKTETTKQEIDEFWNLKTFKQKFQTKDKLAVYLKKLGRGFDINFINSQGKEEQVVMIHRTILGSMERFFGVLIEHYGGSFPLWLAPVQIKIIPIAERHLEYADAVASSIRKNNFRVEIDSRNESMQSKIRDATLQKVPFMSIIGDKEIKQCESEKKLFLSVRTREGKDLGQTNLSEFLDKLKLEIEKKH